MFIIKSDIKRNLLHIQYLGHFDAKQGPAFCACVQKEVSGLRKGFRIISDLSELNTMDISAAPFVEQAMDICNEHGVGMIYRIISNPDKDIGFNIMSSFHYSQDVKILNFKSPEEANHHLIWSSDTKVSDKVIVLFMIIKAKLLRVLSSRTCRLSTLAAGFLLLVLLRSKMKAFGISLGYLYITLISLSAFWFSLRGGMFSALLASAILLLETAFFKEWAARDLMLHSVGLRIGVYFLTGSLIGYLAKHEFQSHQKLEYLTGHDELTGSANFRLIVMLLEKELNRSSRTQKPLTLALLDLDHYRSINDRYGHLVGNSVLKAFAAVLEKNTRLADSIGRYGGDEFLVIFPELSAQQVVTVLKRIKATLKKTPVTPSYLKEEGKQCLTFSAGVVERSEKTDSLTQMINAADLALQQAKKSGCNHTIVYRDHMHAEKTRPPGANPKHIPEQMPPPDKK